MKKSISLILCFVLALSCIFSSVVTASADTKPNYVALVLDVSYTMDIGHPKSRLDSQKEAAKSFCKTTLSTEGNKVAIITFASGAKELCGFTNDIDELCGKIDTIMTTGATYFSAALETANEVLDKEEAKGVSFQRNIVLCSDGTPLGGKSLEEYVYTKDDNSYYYNANYALKYDNEEIKPNTNVYTIGFYESMSGKELEFAKRFMKDLSTNGSVVVDNGDDLVDAFENTASTIITVDTPDTPDKPDSQVITTGSESSSNTSSNSSSSSSSTGGSSNNKSGNTANSTPAASAQTVTSDTVSTGDSSVSFALVLSVSLIAFAVIVFTARKKEAE